MMSTSNNSNEVFENDNYPIPPYDPAIPQEERERLKADAKKRLDKITKSILKTHKNAMTES